jgi:sucrose-6-phosphate hydrolase SacC (GH32 family)
VYTGHGHGRQTQNVAYSNDRGRSWTKYAGNPVIDLNLENFRDPKAFWLESAHQWILVTVLADQHKVRLFGSPDLKRWHALSDFGPAGATGGVWECPDLFPLHVDANPRDVRWVLDVDINPGAIAGGSGGQYFIGRFDGTRFVNDNPPGQTLWVDYGQDFYATTSFSDIPPADGRRIWMAWISNWLYANEEPTVTWRGAQSVPRVLGLRRLPGGIRLVQAPIEELDRLRGGPERAITGAMPLPASADIHVEIRKGEWNRAGLRLSNAGGEELLVGVEAQGPTLVIDRRHAVARSTHKEYAGRHTGPLRWRDDRITMRVVFDASVVEVFANDGETVMTDRFYPAAPLDRIEWAPGTAREHARASMWALESVWRSR